MFFSSCLKCDMLQPYVFMMCCDFLVTQAIMFFLMLKFQLKLLDPLTSYVSVVHYLSKPVMTEKAYILTWLVPFHILAIFEYG